MKYKISNNFYISVQVNKKIPVIIIYLSLDEMPELEATSGHQAPTGPDIFA